MTRHARDSHFLGTKLRALRKQNGLTLNALSTRCIELDTRAAPSVSYLSMIESGKRVPSDEVLARLASLFQRESESFPDSNADIEPTREAQRHAGAATVPLEPAFFFSKELLHTAIPELLSQTGTTGRPFGHRLIGSHQEMSRNDFPDLERAAEGIGEHRFPLDAKDLLALCKHHGLGIGWLDGKPVLARDGLGAPRSMMRSVFDTPATVYLNRELQADPARLKFDLASHLVHKALHVGDGIKSPHATGGVMGRSPDSGGSTAGGRYTA